MSFVKGDLSRSVSFKQLDQFVFLEKKCVWRGQLYNVEVVGH